MPGGDSNACDLCESVSACLLLFRPCIFLFFFFKPGNLDSGKLTRLKNVIFLKQASFLWLKQATRLIIIFKVQLRRITAVYYLCSLVLSGLLLLTPLSEKSGENEYSTSCLLKHFIFSHFSFHRYTLCLNNVTERKS